MESENDIIRDRAKFLAKGSKPSELPCIALLILFDLRLPLNYLGFAYLKQILPIASKEPTEIVLKEIYQASPTMLDKYINKILCPIRHPHFDEHREKNLAFFDLDNTNHVFDTIVDALIASAQYALYAVSDFIESIVMPKQNRDELTQKQDQWIKHFITANFANKDKMNYLFYGIAKLSTERKVSYIKLLLEHNAQDGLKQTKKLIRTRNGGNGKYSTVGT